MDVQRQKIIVEAALLCAAEPLDEQHLLSMFDEGVCSLEELCAVLQALQEDWAARGLELARMPGGWRFQSRDVVKRHIERLHPEKPPKYSRATLETLAVIAYKQPVTRGDIEAIRGVTVSSQTIKTLEDRGWIVSVGHRDAPGRPALWATTTQFLTDLKLHQLSDLPALHGQDVETIDAIVQHTLALETLDADSTETQSLPQA